MTRQVLIVFALGALLVACGEASGPAGKPQPRPKSRAVLTEAALDAQRPVAARVAALVALQGRKDVAASAKATVALRAHRDSRLSTAATALYRVAEGAAKIPGRRVAVVGASLSAGVGAKPLAVLLKMALPADAKVVDCADLFTYEAPWSKTRAQLRRTQQANVDVILAMDTLFWFAYHGRSAKYKRAALERGLKLLEQVKVPLLLGDLPDMRSASPMLIPRSNIPSEALLNALNQRIRVWALKRPNVHVLPFAAWARPLLGKGRISLVPSRPSIPAVDALLVDGLHPNHHGTLYLLHRILQEVHCAFPKTSKERFRTTPRLVDYLMKL